MLPDAARDGVVKRTRLLADIVEASLPDTVWNEIPHRFSTVAPLALARIAGQGRSVAGLLEAGQELDARMIMRSALEHLTLVAWLAIDVAELPAAIAPMSRLPHAMNAARARDRLGRRPYDWRGARPRPWARPRDLRELTASSCDGGQFSLGSIDGRRLWSEPETHVVVVAPTRSGKTTRCVIPWLLEHEGPAIVTSTKRDVLDATRTWRESQGRI